MKKMKFNTIAAGMLLSLTLGLVGTSAAAAETTSPTEPKLGLSIRTTAAVASGFGLLSNPVHERSYLELLVKTYAPDSEQAWNTAFEERKLAQQKLGATINIHFETKSPVGHTEREPFIVRMRQLPEDGQLQLSKEAVVGDKLQQIKIFTMDKTVVQDTYHVPSDVPFPDGIMRALPATLEASPQAKLQEEFAQAIESRDKASILLVLPKLLDNYQETTRMMLESIERLKQSQEEASNNK
jgi:hypothetical protein